MIHLVVYAGFPAALNGVSAAGAVFREKGVDAAPVSALPSTTRYDDGVAGLRAIDGAVGERVIESLKDIAPDLGRFIVEFAFGDVYSRTGINLVLRELITVAGSGSDGFRHAATQGSHAWFSQRCEAEECDFGSQLRKSFALTP